MIKIEKGIPIPKKGTGRPTKYPLALMEVGDCFFVELSWLRRIQAAAYGYSKLYGVKFTVRKTADMVGCWRVS